MKKINSLLVMILMIFANAIHAQTSTEHFETESNGSTSFTDNGVVFNILSTVATYDIITASGFGWNGTTADNKFIDNTGTATSQYADSSMSIKTTSNLFKVNKFWVYLADRLNSLAAPGTLTVTGKLSGVTKFSTTKANGFTTSLGSNNGFTLIDMTNLNGQNYANIVIDELTLTIGGEFRYMAFDAFTWVKDSGIVIDPDAIILTGSATPVSCNGGANGTATVMASNGTGTYTYSWAPFGGSSPSASGLSAGTYTVTVTDTNSQKTASRSFIITEPYALSVSASSSPASCGLNNGQASVITAGGTPPYTYFWSNGATTSSISNLIAGYYNVTITDANGCAITNPFIIDNKLTSAPAIRVNFNSGETLSVFNVMGTGIKWYPTEANAIIHTDALPGSTVISNNTTYYATQTVNGCESTSYLAINAYNPTLNVNDNNKNSRILLFPNPVKNVMNLTSDSKIEKVIITDLSGKRVSEKTLNGTDKLDVQSLTKGTYLIQVFTEKAVETVKFVKD